MAKERNPRYRGLRPHPENFKDPPLKPGEVSWTVRIRSSVAVQEWVKTLGAAEVGRLMTAAYKQAQREVQQATRTTTTRPVRLVPGLFTPTQPHHIALIDDLHAGAVLTQEGEAFHMERPDGSGRAVPAKTARHLLDSGVLVVAEQEGQAAQANTSQSPAERRRATRSAPGRRKD